MSQYVYSPHLGFYIDRSQRDHGYSMSGFHMHRQYELYYQQSGSRRYVIRDGTYFINAGSLVLIDRTEIHKTVSVCDDRFTRYVVNFDESYLAPLKPALESIDLLSCFHNSRKVLNLSLKQRGAVEDCLTRLYALRDPQEAQETVRQRFCLAELLMLVGGYADALPERQTDSKVLNRVVCNITNYVSAHYADDLTLSTVARHLNLSPCYVSRVFKRETGSGLMEYISAVRLRAGKELLETTRLSVSDIAERVGFSTTGHFTYCFRETCGMPPSEYRRKCAVSP